MKQVCLISIAILVVSCASIRHVETNAEFTMNVGDTVKWEGKTLRLNRLILDNRCPVDVNCIVAGHVLFEVLIDRDTYVLDSDTPGLRVGDKTLNLIRVMPERHSEKSINLTDYELLLIIKSGSFQSGN